jgi:ethanolamine ammonia-lyase large subunit
MGVPGSDDIMLNYQSTSFHDAVAAREIFGLRPAPEFVEWLERMGICRDGVPAALETGNRQKLLRGLEAALPAQL